MTELMMVVLALVPLDALPNQPTQTPSAVDPRQGLGSGAYIIGGFFGLAIIVLAMVLLRLPKRANRPHSTSSFTGCRESHPSALRSPTPRQSTGGEENHALLTVAISHGLLGRPVPSALLPSWPSPAIDATTSRDALSILPKIVKFRGLIEARRIGPDQEELEPFVPGPPFAIATTPSV